jgi:hypothetical protein
MQPLQEAKSLRENPLPEQKLELAKPLHDLQFLDYEIAELEERLKLRRDKRDEILTIIIQNNVREEDDLKLKEMKKVFRMLDIEALKQKFPDEYKSMVDILKQRAIEAAENIGDKIPIGLADEVLNKFKMATVTTTRATSTFSVIRKRSDTK